MLAKLVLLLCTALSAATQGTDGAQQLSGWQHFFQRLSQVTIRSQQLTSLLGKLPDYDFSLTRMQAERSLVHLGHNAQLRRVLHDLQPGTRPISIVVLGGSSSCGSGACHASHALCGSMPRQQGQTTDLIPHFCRGLKEGGVRLVQCVHQRAWPRIPEGHHQGAPRSVQHEHGDSIT